MTVLGTPATIPGTSPAVIKRENPDIEGHPGDWGDVGDGVVLAQVPVEPQHLAEQEAGGKRRWQEKETKTREMCRRHLSIL